MAKSTSQSDAASATKRLRIETGLHPFPKMSKYWWSIGWNAVQEITKPNSPVTQPSSSSYGLPPISNSPIKTFIPISEVKNCLVDFKNQFGNSKSKRETLPKVTRINRRRKVEKSMEDEHMIGKAPLICSLSKDLIPENLQYDKGKSRVTNYVQHIQDQWNG